MRWIVILVAALLTLPALADSLTADLGVIQQRWAEIQYQLPEAQREKSFETLAKHSEQLLAAYPNRAEPLIWHAIVQSTWAGAKGGLGALKLVREARRNLEAAVAIDDTALEGSAYTSLGSLYYQVPGWPVGFGNSDKARRYLQKALVINPDGIDPNYFFADYLIEQGEKERARAYLERALAASDRPGRALADQGRREEIRQRMAQLGQ